MDEATLRAALHAAATVAPSDDLALRVDHRIGVHQRRATHRRQTVVGALAAFVVVVGVVAYAIGNRGDGTTIVPATPRTGVPGWAPIGAAPIGPRAAQVQAWTGQELVIFGGYGATGDRLRGAAAYDPARGTWREIADPGTRWYDPLPFWDGEQLLVFDNPATLQSYDPATDEWRDRAPSPIAGENRPSAGVWTGTELVIVDVERSGRSPVAAYDPGTDSWRVLPDAPFAVGSVQLSWTGHEILVVDDHVDLWALDPEAGTWRPLPNPPLASLDQRAGAFSSWTGTELIVGGGRKLDGGPPEVPALDVAAYDPATDSWRSLPGVPVPVTAVGREPAAWTGAEVLTWALTEDLFNLDGRPVLLDPSTGTWRVADAPPDGAHQWAPPTWTGHEVLWWSGEPTVDDPDPRGCCQHPTTAGWAFTP